MTAKTKSPQDVVWENVSNLMKKKWGKDNLNQLGEFTKINNGGAARLKAKKNYGLDLVDKVASAFGLEPWQLLVPGLRVDAKPEVHYEDGISPEEKERVRKALEHIDPAQLDMLIDSGELKRLIAGPHYPPEKMSAAWDASQKRKR